MLSYEQINDTEKNLYNALNDFRQCFDDLKIYCINKPRQKSVKIEKLKSRLYTYLTNGIPFEIAKKQLLIEFDLTSAQINSLLNPVYAQYLITLKPYKIYAAHKLHAAGISNKNIAALLEVTPQTVCKYLCINPKL